MSGRGIRLFMAAILLTVSLWPAQVSYAEGNEEAGKKITVDYTGRSEGFATILYDNTNGLPTSEANAILETKGGFLWIGSYSGLIRYDGNTFTRMDSTTGIASVVSLYVDSKDCGSERTTTAWPCCRTERKFTLPKQMASNLPPCVRSRKTRRGIFILQRPMASPWWMRI